MYKRVKTLGNCTFYVVSSNQSVADLIKHFISIHANDQKIKVNERHSTVQANKCQRTHTSKQTNKTQWNKNKRNKFSQAVEAPQEIVFETIHALLLFFFFKSTDRQTDITNTANGGKGERRSHKVVFFPVCENHVQLLVHYAFSTCVWIDALGYSPNSQFTSFAYARPFSRSFFLSSFFCMNLGCCFCWCERTINNNRLAFG